MNVIGITATRHGLTPAQAERLVFFLSGGIGWPVDAIHHGDCVGGDADADAVAVALAIPRTVHPPDNPVLRANCHGETILDPKPYKDRNRDIVASCGLLIAFPATVKEQRYGGTWGTVQYARSRRKPCLIIRPDGLVISERYDWKPPGPGAVNGTA